MTPSIPLHARFLLLAALLAATALACSDPAGIAPQPEPSAVAIVFERVVQDRSELWIVHPGSAERRLVPGFPAAEPAVSPDGTRIVFVSYREFGRSGDLYVVNRDGSGLRRLTSDPGLEHQPAWSPDGTRILYRAESDGTSDIWVMRHDGANPVNLTGDLLPAVIDEAWPAWSHDGRRIAYIRTVGGESDLWVMDADGRNTTQWTFTAAQEARPAWSPDGGFLAFSQRLPGKASDIAVVSRNGRDVLRVELPGDQEAPAWSPDSQLLAFTSAHEGTQAIYTVHFYSFEIARQSSGGAGDTHPAWLPRR